MTHRVTVIVAVCNGAPFLRQTIESLVAQTTQDFRFLCIDNASTDGSGEIARSVGGSRLEILRYSNRVGMAANWNRCLESASTPYLVIAHQDDVYEPAFVEDMVSLIEAHPRAFMAHARAQPIDQDGRPISTAAGRYKETFWPAGSRYERGGATELDALLGGNYIACPSAMLRIDACRTIGPFSDRYDFVTDWEYWIRGILAGYTLCGTTAPLVRWRRHASTLTSAHAQSLRRFSEEIDVLEWAGPAAGSAGFTVPSRKLFRAARNTILAEFASRLAGGEEEAARALLTFAAERLPAGSGLPPPAILRTLLHGGRPAGRFLEMLESLWVRVAAQLRR